MMWHDLKGLIKRSINLGREWDRK